jgi:ribosomal protein S18 acetylase RimI-like enzyme
MPGEGEHVMTNTLHTLNLASLPPSPLHGRPARRWVPVRTLRERHRARILAHLLGLSDADRLLRFRHHASDANIAQYLAQLNFDRDELFGVFNRRLQLLALGHLACPGGQPTLHTDEDQASAELGLSVCRTARSLGLGTRLFAHAVSRSRQRGLRSLVILAARENLAMLQIARRAGASLTFAGGEVSAQLHLPAQTTGSWLATLMQQRAAEWDYRFKHHSLR